MGGVSHQSPHHNRPSMIGRQHSERWVIVCRLDGWEGQLVADPGEVHAWRFADVHEVRDDMQEHPDSYTAWFRDEIRALL